MQLRVCSSSSLCLSVCVCFFTQASGLEDVERVFCWEEAFPCMTHPRHFMLASNLTPSGVGIHPQVTPWSLSIVEEVKLKTTRE